MTAALVILAIVAAARGTWSPCGLSMLSQVTPLAERARRTSFARTAGAFVVGATIGGALLGCAMGSVGVALDALALPGTTRVLVACAVVAVCVAADLRIAGLRLPDHPRQVDERWVHRYRPWVYGAGFGFQLGTGVSTYVMTNGVYATVLAAAVLCTPVQSVVVGAVFGLARGLTIYVGAGVTSTERLRVLHRGLAQLATASSLAAVLAQVAVLALLTAELPWMPAVAGASCVLAVIVVLVARAGWAARERVAAVAP